MILYTCAALGCFLVQNPKTEIKKRLLVSAAWPLAVATLIINKVDPNRRTSAVVKKAATRVERSVSAAFDPTENL